MSGRSTACLVFTKSGPSLNWGDSPKSPDDVAWEFGVDGPANAAQPRSAQLALAAQLANAEGIFFPRGRRLWQRRCLTKTSSVAAGHDESALGNTALVMAAKQLHRAKLERIRGGAQLVQLRRVCEHTHKGAVEWVLSAGEAAKYC